MRVGILGAGFIAPVHVDALRRLGGVEVVAIAASSEPRARERAAVMGIPAAYGDYRALLADSSIEVVHNCTPTPLHAETTSASLAAGKHVVADKPLASTLSEAQALLAAARSAGRLHAVTFNHRAFRAVQQLRAFVAGGGVGPVHAVRGGYLQGWMTDQRAATWRTERGRLSGTLLDIGSHWLDLVEWVTGLRVSAVLADLHLLHPERGPLDARRPGGSESGSILLRFAGGAKGVTTIAQTFTGRRNRLTLEVYGQAGGVIWNSESPDAFAFLPPDEDQAHMLYGHPSVLGTVAGVYGAAPAQHVEGWSDAWRNLLAPIYARLRGLEGGPFPTFEDGVRVAVLLEQVQASHTQERWIEVPPLDSPG